MFASELGVVDFHPSADCAVIYISAAEMIEGVLYRKRLAGLKAVRIYSLYKSMLDTHILKLILYQVKGIRKVIVCERTYLSLQQFSALQQFAVLELDLDLIPVTENSLSSLLIQMVIIKLI